MTTPPTKDRTAEDRLVLQERARALARPPESEQDGDGLVLLSCTVAGQKYAVEVRYVREVLPHSDVSQLPWAQPSVPGVMSIRGEVVAVVDAARLLGLADGPAGGSDGGPVVVLSSGGEPVALRVENVEDVLTIATTDLVAPTGDGARGPGELILALTASMVVLDAPALIRDPRLTSRTQEVT